MGRPALISKDIFCNTILAHKNKVFVDNKLVQKSQVIWDEISNCFEKKISGKSIYAMVCADRYGILKCLRGDSDRARIAEDNSENSISSSDGDDDSIDNSSFHNKKCIEFEFEIPKESFEEMTVKVEYVRSTIEASNRKRKYLKFKSGMWQSYFNKVFWDHFHMECGLNYKEHNLSLNKLSGHFKGNYFNYISFKKLSININYLLVFP